MCLNLEHAVQRSQLLSGQLLSSTMEKNESRKKNLQKNLQKNLFLTVVAFITIVLLDSEIYLHVCSQRQKKGVYTKPGLGHGLPYGPPYFFFLFSEITL